MYCFFSVNILFLCAMENTKTLKPRVAVAMGETREEAVGKALELVQDDILAKVRGRVLIKPNFLSSVNPLASTMADAVKPVLNLLCENGVDPNIIIIGEGATRSTCQAFDNFGYRNLAGEFGVELVDLNYDSFSHSIELLTDTRRIHTIEYSDIAEHTDTIISVAVAKTHDFATVTLSLKNMMGCLKRIKRPRMHGIQIGDLAESTGEKLWNVIEDHSWMIKVASSILIKFVKLQRLLEKRLHKGATPGLLAQVSSISENLVRIGEVLMPDVAVIDAFNAMEGEGPGGGTPVNMRLAVAGTDPIACDSVMAFMMGFNPLSIGFLALANERKLGVADLESIEILGEDPSEHIRHFKPHSNYPVQRRWRESWKE